MDDVREIVTKAVVSKGKKLIKITETIDPGCDLCSILGVWVINHKYNAKIININEVKITGSAEVDIWASQNSNTQTDVIRHNINYNELVKTRQLVKDLCNDNLDVLVTITTTPSCTNVEVTENGLVVEVTLEIVVEAIGETKVQVIICEPIELLDDNFENEINEDFIKEG